MIESLAAAVLLAAINTIADYISQELKLAAKPVYLFARVMLVCYCTGALVGARAKQFMMGTVGGLMIGALLGAVYHLIAPEDPKVAFALVWLLFWPAFSLLEALLEGGRPFATVTLQGVAAAVISGGLFYAMTNAWVNPPGRDPSLWRSLAWWAAAFFPGFIVLFWRRV
jgi:hypothetical protein